MCVVFAYVVCHSPDFGTVLVSDKEMILELERMRARHGMCGKEQSPSRLDGFVKSLEEERNYYKQELERYRLLRGRTDKSPTPSPGRGRSPRGRGSWHGKVGADIYFCNYN